MFESDEQGIGKELMMMIESGNYDELEEYLIARKEMLSPNSISRVFFEICRFFSTSSEFDSCFHLLLLLFN